MKLSRNEPSKIVTTNHVFVLIKLYLKLKSYILSSTSYIPSASVSRSCSTERGSTGHVPHCGDVLASSALEQRVKQWHVC